MTSAQEQVRRAGKLVRTAADRWDAASLSAIGNSVSVLESSAGSLAAAAATLNSLQETPGIEIRASLLELKRDTERLQRLVDASAAFLRYLPGAQSADVELYESSGSMRKIAAPDSWGLQA